MTIAIFARCLCILLSEMVGVPPGMHGSHSLPQVPPRIEPLHTAETAGSICATTHVQHPIQDCHSGIAAATDHARSWHPCAALFIQAILLGLFLEYQNLIWFKVIYNRVKLLHTGHVGCSVITSDCIDAVLCNVTFILHIRTCSVTFFCIYTCMKTS